MTVDPAESLPAASSVVQQQTTSPEPAKSPALLDTLVEISSGRSSLPATGARLQRFLESRHVGDALQAWLGEVPEDKETLVRRLNRDVARIDRWLNDQLNAILHHPDFQSLEASWRGLHYLTECVEREGDRAIKIRVLNATWRELERDFERAIEFDQSETFQKVYEDEFGTAGGEPFGVLVADFEIQPRPSAQHPHDDIAVLQGLAQVAAAAFCPVITNASPALFGMNDFSGLQNTIDHARTFTQASYLRWRQFRESDHARFVGLTLPRVLMRCPYADDGSRVDRFPFQEDVTGRDASKYLWGGAAFAMCEVLIRAFAQSGWLADIRGVRRNEERGGLVTGLPTHCFSTDKIGIAAKSSTDIIVTDELEKQLSDLGFIPLCHCKDTEYSAFYSNQSVQKPKTYDRPIATMNARISTMLQYMLCVSRFAHYIKVIGREKTGSFTETEEFESYLRDWVANYVTADSEASPEVKSRHPLREAQVQVFPEPGRPGAFHCIMHLAPHYELDDLHASVRLQSALSKSD